MKKFLSQSAHLASVITYIVIAMSFVAYKHYWMIPICIFGALCALHVNFKK